MIRAFFRRYLSMADLASIGSGVYVYQEFDRFWLAVLIVIVGVALVSYIQWMLES